MRIAVSGAHRTGKTALVEELGRALPTYEIVDEPYYLLEEEGHEFAAMPSLEDFELQLERSIYCLLSGEGNQIFDRCPADILAYLLTHQDSDSFNVELWLPRIRTAMQRLQLIVYVPIENPDRVNVATPDKRLRVLVDDEMRDILQEDRCGFGAEVIEVTGSPCERARQVLTQIACLEK
jgi:predicted ATPase